MTVPLKDDARFVETTIEDEIVVMNIDTGDFFSLRDTARDIWRLIDGEHDRLAIVTALAQEYDAPESALAADLDAFLAELDAAGVLKSR